MCEPTSILLALAWPRMHVKCMRCAMLDRSMANPRARRASQRTHLEIEGLGAAAAEVGREHLVHDRNDDTAVAVRRQKSQRHKIADEGVPVPVAQVDGRAHHGLPVLSWNLCHQPKIQESQLPRMRALGHLYITSSLSVSLPPGESY